MIVWVSVELSPNYGCQRVPDGPCPHPVLDPAIRSTLEPSVLKGWLTSSGAMKDYMWQQCSGVVVPAVVTQWGQLQGWKMMLELKTGMLSEGGSTNHQRQSIHWYHSSSYGNIDTRMVRPTDPLSWLWIITGSLGKRMCGQSTKILLENRSSAGAGSFEFLMHSELLGVSDSEVLNEYLLSEWINMNRRW